MHVSDPYAHIIDKARWSHAHGRNVEHLQLEDIAAARLFSYGYRSQTIGAFHAARVALEAESHETGPYVDNCLYQARILLEQLESKAADPVLEDHRVLISTFHTYDKWTNMVVDVLSKACARGTNPKLEVIRHLFLQNIQRVTAGNGLYIARDQELPEQGSFVVPDLDIAIAPIIYGDHHSWNAAFLAAGRPGVSVHRHHEGAEIHLGYTPVQGQTILGDAYSEVKEGYAMPIPPMTDHGFFNTSGHDHVVPFVFGSKKLAGWGVFFDVEPRPGDLTGRSEQPLQSARMNHSVFLERSIQKVRTARGTSRELLIPAHRAGSTEIGGLELSLTRIEHEMEMLSAHYRIVSVQHGHAHVCIGGAEVEVHEHDHFGIPANMDCRITRTGTEPLVLLDAMLVPVHKFEQAKTEDAIEVAGRT